VASFCTVKPSAALFTQDTSRLVLLPSQVAFAPGDRDSEARSALLLSRVSVLLRKGQWCNLCEPLFGNAKLRYARKTSLSTTLVAEVEDSTPLIPRPFVRHDPERVTFISHSHNPHPKGPS
jgi:hypothetical protein